MIFDNYILLSLAIVDVMSYPHDIHSTIAVSVWPCHTHTSFCELPHFSLPLAKTHRTKQFEQSEMCLLPVKWLPQVGQFPKLNVTLYQTSPKLSGGLKSHQKCVKRVVLGECSQILLRLLYAILSELSRTVFFSCFFIVQPCCDCSLLLLNLGKLKTSAKGLFEDQHYIRYSVYLSSPI